MLNFINNRKAVSLLFLAPVLWITTGMLWDGDGDMRLVPIVLVIAALSLFVFRFAIIKDNLKSSFWVKLLFINGLFGALAYEVYGFDSRELRATLVMLFLFLTTPKNFYTKSAMQWLLFIASISCSSYSYYYQINVSLFRGEWPINAIPFATICGLVSISSLGLLLTRFEEKNTIVLIVAVTLSMAGLLLSQSRGPLIALIVVVFLLLLYVSYRKNWALCVLTLLCLVVGVGGLFKLPVIQDRIERTIQEYHLIEQGHLNSSIGVRLQMVGIGIELWQRNPMLGYGKDIKIEFDKLEYEKRITPSLNRLISMTFHNGYVDKFVLYGLLGGLIFLTFLFYPIWKARQYTIERGAVLLWAPALFVAICNFSDAPFINSQAAIYYMFIIGSVTMILSNEKERE
ncbi:putative O-antigen ligase [Vibrio orientalis CIP 102891 = ATCC 33934]|uniref:O-antigen ligase n=2 Tax=Vibrio orientalis TaxID=28175 RepID=C9QDI3_VIBOR|nr:O-antigen ligase [Vibrio orientalis CIP 102891 = ATCC 33934]EGU52146.1 putative O-antigen ligase [Vibrio orientalis CIP 102891 = ATCC 33934]